MPIDDISELQDGETYHYTQHGPNADPDRLTFTVDLTHMDDDDFDGYGEGAISLHYHDGYVADVPVSNIEEQIEEGKIAEGPL